MVICLNIAVYFNWRNPNQMFICVDRQLWMENFDNPENIIENIGYRARGGVPFGVAGCNGTKWSAEGAERRPVLFAIDAVAPPKASLWSVKINQLNFFAAGGNNTSELNSNWTTEVEFLNQILRPYIIRIMCFSRL